MKHIKKIVSAILVLGLVFSLAACSSGSSGGNGTKKTLTVSVDSANSAYAEFVNSIKGKFEKENNVKVKIVKKPMLDQLTALTLDGPAGKAPDVMLAPYDRVGGLGQQGQLLEVDKGMLSFLSDKGQRQVEFDKKYYGVPLTIEALVLYYNKDLVKTAPKTFKDLEALAKDKRFAFKSEAGKNTGFLAKWTDFYFAYGLYAGYGGYVFGNNDTNPKDIGLNNEGSVEAVTYATHWFQKVWPKGMQDVKAAGNFVTNQFVKGKAGAVIDGPWQAAVYKKSKINYGVAKIPTLPNGQEYKPFAGGKAWVASSYTKNPSLAKKWLAYATNATNAYKFYTDANEIPINLDAQAKVNSSKDELAKAVIKQYDSSVPMPNIPEVAEVWTTMEPAMFNAASGKKTPKQTLDDAVSSLHKTIKQKYKDK
ncbi:extracellular solute-binding protein [Sporolactobacillus terrae]|uniref:Maltodextrin-binding protein n=1 Tax=Sporolactobacillus terrae TaxID=269673 RepID=A0ABX5Q975_9BACL|nr:extracellular solute-binding protein [Sporolactobacillus terrae]QAA23157.1 sugar ABC transporter substrate-binding protein [Sporolactobacillus terrae]QAA26127.1 sugar ABC transporter substrate-binding protein [Sporolactobacillus terrae]UAK15223.1 extracellular solute-binding protein [Sporolactobacillus terrae]